MASKAFKAIAEGLEDAIAFAKGDRARGRIRTPNLPDIDIARLRASLGLSQREFAEGFGVSLGTLRNWEQGRRQPEGPARVLLTVIRKDPQRVVRAIWPARPSRTKRRSAA